MFDVKFRRRAVIAAVVLSFAGAGCTTSHPRAAPVGESEARHAFDDIVSVASERTPAAMDELCALSLDSCRGLSGSIRNAPDGFRTAPRPNTPPRVLCSRNAGNGDWMLIVAGDDGLRRPYVSQVVFARNAAGRPVPLREPAYWYGIVYYGKKVTGATGWTSAYGGPGEVQPARVKQLLQQARTACVDTVVHSN